MVFVVSPTIGTWNLLGVSYSDLSRYETREREVSFRVGLSCCLLYGFTARQVFAGMYELCSSLLNRRLTLLRKRLVRHISKNGSSGTQAHKLSWVTARLAHLSVASL